MSISIRPKTSESLKKFWGIPENRERLKLIRKKQYENGFNPTLGKHWKQKPETIAKRIGEKNHEWKGDRVGYVGLHLWVKRNLGKPERCEHCEKDGLRGRAIHWANKSGNYIRDLEDWIRLCASCHTRYDGKWASRERNKKGQFISL